MENEPFEDVCNSLLEMKIFPANMDTFRKSSRIGRIGNLKTANFHHEGWWRVTMVWTMFGAPMVWKRLRDP